MQRPRCECGERDFETEELPQTRREVSHHAATTRGANAQKNERGNKQSNGQEARNAQSTTTHKKRTLVLVNRLATPLVRSLCYLTVLTFPCLPA